jgi:hypothetical protein
LKVPTVWKQIRKPCFPVDICKDIGNFIMQVYQYFRVVEVGMRMFEASTYGFLITFTTVSKSKANADVFNRDDLTVEVIFFGEGPASGNVTLNKEASASSSPGDVKAKL